jgi:hypothetical protein
MMGEMLQPVEDVAHDGVVARVIIRLVVQTHAENVALIGISATAI